MSTPSQIIAKARRQTYSNTVSYTDTDAILDLNNRLQVLYDRIVTEVNEGYFWDYNISDSVIGQSEYTIAETTTKLINQIDSVSVKYKTTDTYYTKLKAVSYESLDNDLATYADYAGEPFYFVKDQSIFIYPAPTEIVTGGIKIFSIQQPLDVTISSTEKDIKVQPRFHHSLVYGLVADYWYSNGREDKGNLYEQKFTQGGDHMVKSMKNREQEVLEWDVSTNKFC